MLTQRDRQFHALRREIERVEINLREDAHDKRAVAWWRQRLVDLHAELDKLED